MNYEYKYYKLNLTIDNTFYGLSLTGNLNNIFDKNKNLLVNLGSLKNRRINDDRKLISKEIMIEEFKNLEFLEREALGYIICLKYDENGLIIMDNKSYMEEFYEKVINLFNSYKMDKLKTMIIKDKVEEAINLIKELDNELVKKDLKTREIEFSITRRFNLTEKIVKILYTIFEIRGGLVYKKKVLSNIFIIYNDNLLYVGSFRDKGVFDLQRRKEILYYKLEFIKFLLFDKKGKIYKRDLFKNAEKLSLYCVYFLKYKKIGEISIIEDNIDYSEELYDKLRKYYDENYMEYCKKLVIYKAIQNLQKKAMELGNLLREKHLSIGKIELEYLNDLEKSVKDIIYGSFELRGAILYQYQLKIIK